MKSFKDKLGKTLKEVVSEPAMEAFKTALKEKMVPALKSQFKDVSDSLFSNIKEKVKDAALTAIKESVKKEIVPDFDNKALNTMSNVVADSILDKVIPTVFEKVKDDFLTEEMVVKIIHQLFKKPDE